MTVFNTCFAKACDSDFFVSEVLNLSFVFLFKFSVKNSHLH